MKNAVILLFLIIFPLSLNAVGEDSLAKEYNSLIVPYFKENGIIREITMADGAVLKYQSITHTEKQNIVILLGGHTESFVKYAELFYDLRDIGLSIYALDQRGQGFSARMLPNREKDYIDDYQTYLTDLEQFIKDVVHPRADAKVIILGHSLGGAVAAAYAERHPNQLSGLILSSPYLGSKAGPFALFIVQVLDFLGMGKEYVPGGRPFSIVPFEENKETHSRIRHERKMQDYIDNPTIRLGSPTNHWMTEMEKMGRDIRNNSKRITCPTLVLQAETDEYADRRAQDDFCTNIPKCEKVVLYGAFHEVLIEKDEIRDVALAKVRSFLQGCCP